LLAERPQRRAGATIRLTFERLFFAELLSSIPYSEE
jgi:hypothetical protein